MEWRSIRKMSTSRRRKSPGLHVLVDLSKLMPKYFFNAYGAAEA